MIIKNHILILFSFMSLLLFQSAIIAQEISTDDDTISMIKQIIGKSDHDLIIKDTGVNIVDVLLTDSHEIGYVMYEFSANVIHAKSLKTSSQIKYIITYEGSKVPQLKSDLYFISIQKNRNNKWMITEEGIKIVLPDKKLKNIVTKLILK